MNVICRSLTFELNANKPNDVRSESTDIVVALTSENTLRILNTINPVTRIFTTMDAAKPVRVTVCPQGRL